MVEGLVCTTGKKLALFVAWNLSLYKEVRGRSTAWLCVKVNL